MAKKSTRVKSGKPIRANRIDWTKKKGVWEKIPLQEQGKSHKKVKE